MFEFPFGVYTALVTPFSKDNEMQIQWDDLEKLIELQVNSAIEGLVILGTTAEAPTLLEHEKRELVKFVHEKVNGRKPIIVGVGGNFTYSTLEFAKFATSYASALMVTVPHYNKPQQRGIEHHFISIAQNIKHVPIIMYNIPGRTCINMTPETVVNIVNSCPNIVAIKEASGDLKQVETLIKLIESDTNRTIGDTFKVFAGDDSSVRDVTKLGGSGVISVASNIVPEFITNISSLSKAEELISKDILCNNFTLHTLDEMMKILNVFTTSLFVETNPVPIKYLLYLTGIFESDSVRAPLDKLRSEQLKENIKHDFDKVIQCVLNKTIQIDVNVDNNKRKRENNECNNEFKANSNVKRHKVE